MRWDLAMGGVGGGPGVAPLVKMAGAAASPDACPRGAAGEPARRPFRSGRSSLPSGVAPTTLHGQGISPRGRQPIRERGPP